MHGPETKGNSKRNNSHSSFKISRLCIIMHLFDCISSGTSISFGFKKKSYTISNKKQQNITNNNGIRETDEQLQKGNLIFSNLNVIKDEQEQEDTNGNTNSTGNYKA